LISACPEHRYTQRSVKMSIIKNAAKKLLPPQLLNRIVNYRRRKQFIEGIESYTKDLTVQEVFTKVYTEKAWGKSDDPTEAFCSGTGSRDSAVVKTYIESVESFLSGFQVKPNVVDLGCGDFVIGSKIRPWCGNYIACDIVAPLIEFNKDKYKSMNVDFRVLNLIEDDLPKADVLFIRQVLQHLSNKQIKQALPQITAKCKYLILTEHLPSSESFTPNRDIPGGLQFRLPLDSGIVLTSPPFDLKPKSQTTLCQVGELGGIIKTIAYEF
jgi:thiol-disulfide isomerase/thioredoxin